MRNVIVLALLLCLVGCANMTASLWSENDSSAVGTRIGYATENTEFGGSVVYWPDGEQKELFGGYALYKDPNMVEIPNPIRLDDFLPATFVGTPYIGGIVDIDGDNTSLIAGVEINNTLFIEYQRDIILVGLKRKF